MGTLLVLLALVGTVLANSNELTARHRSRRQATFSCNDDETMIWPPTESEPNTKCNDVIGRGVARYKLHYRQHCQRWQGLSALPDFINSNYVDSCTQSGTTAVYKSRVCCEGSTQATRCFTCSNVTNQYECVQKGTIQTCGSTQVCMTQSKDYQKNTYSVGRRYAQCADKSYCDSLYANRTQTCQHYTPGAFCLQCCSGNFCNYAIGNYYRHGVYDNICDRVRCSNGATCVKNSTLSAGYHCVCAPGWQGSSCSTPTNTLSCKNGGLLSYIGSQPICFCPIGKTGNECQLDASECSSSERLCQNGGTCYDHRGFGSGYRCHCDEGFVGANCELSNKIKCVGESKYFKLKYTDSSLSKSYNKYSCTTFANAYGASPSGRYYYCPSYMRVSGRPTFSEGVHGTVGNKVQKFGVNKCSIGDGFLTYNFHQCCPSCYSNPCMNGGWCQQDSQWNHVCQCRFGYEGKNCESKVTMCIISGDPHYNTLDGAVLHYQGTCPHLALAPINTETGLPNFMVIIHTETRKGNTKVTYPNVIQIKYNGYDVRLKRSGVVTVNNIRVYPDHDVPPHFRITMNGKFVRFEAPGGLVIDYDGSWEALIRVPDSYKGKVDGICGNYDDDASNDMVTSAKIPTTSYTEIGNSWMVSDPDYPSCSNPTEDLPSTCDGDIETLVSSDGYCGLLNNISGVFGSCYRLNPEQASKFYESCRYDVCALSGNMTAGKELACSSLSSYASYCQAKGSPVLWRTAATCPLSCPTGMTYQEKSSACHATCAKPDAPEVCSYPDTEKCACPDAMVLLNGQCQTPDKCPCPDGHKMDENWLSTDCTTQYLCRKCGGECPKRKVARVYEVDHKCSASTMCRPSDGVGQCISCSAPGGWGKWTNWASCNESTQTQTRTRLCNNPAPACGGSCTGDGEQSRSCSTASASGTAIEPPIPRCTGVTNFNFQAECGKRNLITNSALYIANPCSCKTFYQCAPFGGIFHVYERPCPPCACWNHEVYQCMPDKSQNCVNGPATPPENLHIQGTSCTKGLRRFGAHSNPYKYMDMDFAGIVMPCPGGTIFNLQSCECIRDVTGGVTSTKKATICMNFDDRDPLTNDQEIFVAWSKETTSNNVENGGLRFSGDRLEIPYYENKQLMEFTIRLSYKRDNNRGSMTLLSNDDQTAGLPPIHIYTTASTVSGAIYTSANQLSTFDAITVSSGDWHHVVISYDGVTMKLYVDDKAPVTKHVSGSIPRIKSPLLLGSLYSSDYFYGLMDNICLYDYALSHAQIKKL